MRFVVLHLSTPHDVQVVEMWVKVFVQKNFVLPFVKPNAHTIHIVSLANIPHAQVVLMAERIMKLAANMLPIHIIPNVIQDVTLKCQNTTGRKHSHVTMFLIVQMGWPKRDALTMIPVLKKQTGKDP